MGINSNRAVNSHIAKGQKEKPRREYPLVNTKYGDRPSLKMAMKDKHCLVPTTCLIRSESEKKIVPTHYIQKERDLTQPLNIRGWGGKAIGNTKHIPGQRCLLVCSFPFNPPLFFHMCFNDSNLWQAENRMSDKKYGSIFAFICISSDQGLALRFHSLGASVYWRRTKRQH